MNWIFPMAGFGTRTKKLGNYKPQIEILPNYSIFKLCVTGLKSLIDPKDTFIFIASEYQYSNFSIEKNIKQVFEDLGLSNKTINIALSETPPGQALTVKTAIEGLDDTILKDKTFVINSDQFLFFDINKVDLNKNSVGLYFNDGSSSCFFDLEINNKKVNQIKEKEKISHYASAGVFYFTSARNIIDCVNWAMRENKFYKNELYLGPCMEYFQDLSYFKTLVKFDLGNIENINLFKMFFTNLNIGTK